LLCVSQLSFGQSRIRTFMLNQKNKRENSWAAEHVYSTSALSLTYQTVQQQVFSQNQFSGVGLSFFHDKLVDRTKIQRGTEQTIAASTFLKSPLSETNTNAIDVQVGFYWLKKLKNPALSVGGQLNFVLGTRLNPNYDNNSVSGEAIIELAPKLKYRKEFSFLSMPLGIDYSFSASLLGAALYTPTFTSNFTLIGMRLAAPNSYNHFNSRLLVSLPAGKRFPNKKMTLGYGWNMYILKANNEQNIINATHTIYLIANLHKFK
jgi:hypothetical protein